MKKQKWYLTQSNRYLKLVMAAFMIYVAPLHLCAQSTDSYKNFINKSSVAVYEVQKTVIAAHKTDVNGKLAQLVLLQMNAVILFNKKEYDKAAYYSNLARQNAINLILSLNGNKNDFYTASEEEKKLFENVVITQSNLETRKNIPTYSEKDEDYLTPNAIAREKIEIH